MQNPLAFDPVALRAQQIQRHGALLGAIVADAEIARRQAEDERHATLAAELEAVLAQTHAILTAAGEQRAIRQAKLQAVYADYLALCKTEADLESAETARVAPLRARSFEIQEQMRQITLPRLTERELQDVALYHLKESQLLRSNDKKVSPFTPQLSDFARINMGLEPLDSGR